MLNSLVRKLITEGRPACIKYGFRHAGFGESCRVHVAHGDIVELANDTARQLVNEVAALGGYLSVNLTGLSLLPGALGFTKLFFKLAEVARVVDLLSSRQRSEVLQAKVDTNTELNFTGLRLGYFDNDVQVPVAARILSKAGAVLDLSFGQSAAAEYPECVPVKSESVTLST